MGTMSFSKKYVLKPVIDVFRIGILLEGASSKLLDWGFPRSFFHCLLTLFADDVFAADGTADLSQLLGLFRYTLFDLLRDYIISNTWLANFVNNFIVIQIRPRIHALFDAV